MTLSIMAFLKRTVFPVLLPLVFWLGVWQFCAYQVDLWVDGRGNQLLLPYPLTVLETFVFLSLSPSFWHTIFLSLLRILMGILLGCLLGGLCAVLTSAAPVCDYLLSPVIRIMRATPVASFILLLLLWFYRDTVPTIVVALMVLPIFWETMAQGITAVDPQLLELTRAYHFTPLQTIKILYLPSLRPYLFSGLANGIGLGWKSGVAAEVLCLPKLGIGTEIYLTKQNLNIPALFAWTITVVALSFVMEQLLTLWVSKKGGSV